MPLSIVDIMNFTNYFSVLSLDKSVGTFDYDGNLLEIQNAD